MRVIVGGRSNEEWVEEHPSVEVADNDDTVVSSFEEIQELGLLVAADSPPQPPPAFPGPREPDAVPLLDDESVDMLLADSSDDNGSTLAQGSGRTDAAPDPSYAVPAPTEASSSHLSSPTLGPPPVSQPGTVGVWLPHPSGSFSVPAWDPRSQTLTGPVALPGQHIPTGNPRPSLFRELALGLVLTATALAGVVVGKVFFSNSDASRAHPATTDVAAAAPHAPAAPPATEAAAPAPAPAEAAVTDRADAAAETAAAETAAADATAAAAGESSPLTLEVASLTPPEAEAVKSPVTGSVVRIRLSAKREVTKGEPLFEVRHRSGPSAKSRKLAARVKELTKLAEEDVVYEAFLKKAKAEYRRSVGRWSVVSVRAPGAGVAEAMVGRGDRVKSGTPVAKILTGDEWIVTAPLEGDSRPTVAWTCTIQLPDGSKKSACTLTEVSPSGDLTARVRVGDANWLSEDSRAQLVVEQTTDN
jgi:biotin carboxyl carrier protein